MKQIILCCRQNGLLCRYDIGQLWHVSSVVFQDSTSHMITHWHIHITFAIIFTSHSQFCYLFT